MEQKHNLMTHIVSTKRVSSGKYIDLASLTVDDVNILDINRALNYIYRFTGHWKDNPPLTVAQHTKLVHRLATELFPDDLEIELDCVCHDMPEAYTGDIATPLKKLFGTQFKDYEGQIEDTVYLKLYDPIVKHKLTKEVYEARKVCDLLALDIERRAIWLDPKGKDHWPDIPMENFTTAKNKRSYYEWAIADRDVDLVALYNTVASKIFYGAE